MKKLMISLLALAAMTSCENVNENGVEPINPNDQVEIKMQAGINKVEATTKAAISSIPSQGLNVSFLRATDSATADWATATEKYAKIASDKKISFYSEANRATPATEYYNYNATNRTHLFGYYLGDATAQKIIDGKIISFTINGTQDIMATDTISGTKSKPITSVTFNHLLAQLIFKVKAADANSLEAIKTQFGKITKIEVLEQPTTLTLDPTSSPKLSTTATPTKESFTLQPTSQELTTAEVAFGNEIMVYANSDLGKTATPLKLKVYTENNASGIEVDVTIGDNITGGLAAGKKHEITLTFSLTNVDSTAEIGTWGAGTAGSGAIN